MKHSENRVATPPVEAKELPYPYKAPPDNSSASVPSRDVKVREATPIKLDLNIKTTKQ